VADLSPPVGDVTFRFYRGEVDLEGMADVFNAAHRNAGVERVITIESIANMYRNLTNCDLATDLILAVQDSEVVGYRRAFWYVVEDGGERILTHVGWVAPQVIPMGVGGVLVDWCERRLVEVAAEVPYDGPQWFMAWADEREDAALADLRDRGYALSEIYAEMKRSLSTPIDDHDLPAGVAIRPTTEADSRRVWEADDAAFRDHVGYSAGTEADYQQFVDDPNTDPALWRVAFSGDVIVGQVLNYVDEEENREFGRRRGWTESISTHRDWRGQGVARAVITESMRMFRDMGMDEVALGVHTTNPTGAYRLYEGLGYQVVARQFEYRKEFPA
jgi:ribosomal protein S18 acetylase RimI-like enzyme